MAHRLHHLQKRRVEAAEAQEAVPSSTPAPLHHSHPTTHSPAALRPAFPSTNELKPFDRYGFRSGQPAYPPPDSLYQPKDTEVDPSFLRTTSVFLHSQPRKSVLPIAAWITPFANERVPVV